MLTYPHYWGRPSLQSPHCAVGLPVASTASVRAAARFISFSGRPHDGAGRGLLCKHSLPAACASALLIQTHVMFAGLRQAADPAARVEAQAGRRQDTQRGHEQADHELPCHRGARPRSSPRSRRVCICVRPEPNTFSGRWHLGLPWLCAAHACCGSALLCSEVVTHGVSGKAEQRLSVALDAYGASGEAVVQAGAFAGCGVKGCASLHLPG